MSSSLKILAVLDDAELNDGQMKQVDFGDDGKVLLSKLDGKVHATSAFCTHYGAPLVKGTLEASGRVVCPWHGACFNVCTGDIEDAPAIDGIHSFHAEVKDGKIYVSAKEESTKKANMARPPALSTLVTDSPSDEALVIVGGGAGALHTIETLRLYDFSGSITVLSSENHAPIDRTKISKTLMTDTNKLQWRTVEEYKEKFGVNFRTGVEVTSVDTDAKTVTVGGAEKVKYDILVLATGSNPRTLPVEGNNLGNVFTIRQIPDAEGINKAIAPGKNLVVVGSSFIGMELVVAVAKKELGSVHVVSDVGVPFEKILGRQVGEGLMNYHQRNGVQFHMGSGIKSIKSSSTDPSVVGSVIIADGTEIPADIVVFGVGVRPATEWLKGTNLEQALREDGGLKVDGRLRVEGFPDIFAIGDIAVYPQAQGGKPTRIEHWNVASNHGRSVGETIGKRVDKLAVGFDKVPIFWSAQGQQLRYCGIGTGFDDIIIKGNPEELKFAAYYLKENQIIAVASMQSDPIVTKSAELFRLGLMPTPDEIRGGLDVASIDIVSKRT